MSKQAIFLTGIFFVNFFTLAYSEEVLLYDNTIDTGLWFSPSANGYSEVCDYGQAAAGTVTKIRFAYVTTLSNPGTITVRFYSYVTAGSDPGYPILQFNVSGLQGSWNGGAYIFYKEVELSEGQQFSLYNGQSFGYSFEFSNSNTGAALTYGGNGNQNQFWVYDDWLSWWFLTSFGGTPWAGCYLQLYQDIGPPIDKITCDISGYKFNDVDGNGVWDSGEPNIPGWEIYLDENGNGNYEPSEPNAVTDSNGMYLFENVEFADPNVAEIFVIREIMKDGWTQTLPGGPDYEYVILAEPNNVYGPYDFGNTDQPIPVGVKLSGYVKTTLGVRIKGINISSSTGKTTVTDALGYYELTFPSPFNGTITPSQTDWTFSPASLTYSNITTDQPNQDFTATYSVSFGGGSGTPLNPFLIYTAKQLNAIGAVLPSWLSHFKLMNDINLEDFDGKDGNPSFNRIGYYINFVGNYPFSGVFDGNGHTIYNFTFDSDAGNDGVGIFGYVNASGAQVKNVKLYNIDVNSTSSIGTAGLIGHLDEGTISGCAVEDGSVHGDDHVGGLVGSTWGGTISDCSAEDITVSGEWTIGGLLGNLSIDGVLSDSYASCTVTAKVECGGLVGAVSSSTGNVTRCTSAGNVSINYEGILDRTAGGLAGENRGTIDQCYSTANVAGNGADEIGGLAGRNLGIILDSYAAGDVSGTYPTGGLVGVNVKLSSTDGSITNCYSTGASTGGGLIGWNVDDTGLITNSFWDKEASETNSSDGGTGLMTVDMQNRKTFLDAGWDFVGESANGTDDIWQLCIDGLDYPRLVWQFGPADFVYPGRVDNYDLFILINDWLTDNSRCCDISPAPTPDGIVNILDFAEFSRHWLEGSP